MKTKIQKTLALLLMLAMVLSVVPFGAFADDAVIDFTKNDCTITVTKYATDGSQTGNPATGQPGQTIPSGYTPLQGAEFKLFRIYNETAVLDYYNGTADTLTLDTTLLTGSGDSWEYNSQPITVYQSGTTNSSGQIVFGSLPIGIYILKETTAPDRIISPYAETSLISIPMVNAAYQGGGGSNNNGNAKWMYDVYVYPKNHSAAADVELTKVTEDETTALPGVVFQLYKKELDALGNLPADWTQVTSIQPDAPGDPAIPLNLTTDASGMISITNLPANMYGTRYQLVEVSAPAGYIVNKYPIEFTVKATNEIEWNDALNNANTAIKDHSIAAAVAGTSNPRLELTVRNEKPTLDKKVKDNESGAWAQDTQYQMGETYTYKLTVYVPRNVAELDKFEIIDIADAGITYADPATSGNFVITSDGNTLGNAYYLREDVARGDGKNSFKLTFVNPAAMTYIAGKTITIEYKAYMNGGAMIASTGNNNTASLEYSKQISSGADDDAYFIKDSTRVYTFDFEITKYKDSATAGNELQNVEFKLLKDSATGTEIPLFEIAAGQYRAPLEGEATTTTLKTDSTGKIYVKGLEKGEYYLKETKTVQGYNLLSAPFKIDLKIVESTTWTPGSAYDASSTLTNHTYVSTSYTLNGSAITETKQTANIINKQGFVLPQTGGMGYLLFCTAGLVLIAGGALLIFGGRKKKIR